MCVRRGFPPRGSSSWLVTGARNLRAFWRKKILSLISPGREIPWPEMLLIVQGTTGRKRCALKGLSPTSPMEDQPIKYAPGRGMEPILPSFAFPVQEGFALFFCGS